MPVNFQVLAYEDTPLGLLCLRRRKTLKEPTQWVTEITLNHEFLMSSLHTDSERALANIPITQRLSEKGSDPLEASRFHCVFGLAGEGQTPFRIASQHQGAKLKVLIGGLGLGFTAHSALAYDQVAKVKVVELLPQVIQWTRDGLTPPAAELNADPRLSLSEGDIFHRLLSPPAGQRFDVILIDVDHSPEDQLGSGGHSLYCVEGLEAASGHLSGGGIFALWSYDRHTPLFDAMQTVFADSSAHPITYFNRHIDESFTDWLSVGCRRREQQ